MSRVLVIGDLVIDHSVHGTATRLCPEAPCPVIVPDGPAKITRGGAGLVTDQLRELIGKENVIAHFGSKSIKKRVFADGRLICRVDHDSVFVSPRNKFEGAVGESILGADYVIVSDYGKGAMTAQFARELMIVAEARNIPVFVDAKTNWLWYPGAFAVFPNQREQLIFPIRSNPKHIIQKLGPLGCKVNGFDVCPDTERLVRDSTGAGDIFLAAFVAEFRHKKSSDLLSAAEFANHVAGLSVEKIGTHIVTLDELESY